VLETSEFAVLHLSSAILDKSVAGKSTKLYAKLGKDAEVIIASLNDKNEQVNLDHYINCTQNVSLFVKGPSEIHLTGYFEPKGEDMDDDMFYGQEAEDAEEDDSEEEEKPKSKAVEASLKQAKLNSARNASAKPALDDDESDLEDDMIDDDEEDLEDMDDLDLDAEEEESEEEEIRVPQKKASPKAPVVPDSDEDSDDLDD
jgi:hypothetical protein